MKNKWNIFVMAAVGAVWLLLAVTAWLRPADAASDSERRELAQFPEISAEKLLDGSFMTDFEDYTLDQFPLRDTFRKLKAGVHYYVLGQRDNNDIYLSGGQAAKLEYPLNDKSLAHALQVFGNIREKYLQDSNIYTAVVPDKNYYLADKLGYPSLDYEKLMETVQEGMPYAQYVDLTDCLTVEDYYRTDTHWRQERLLPAAQKLCNAMGIPMPKAEDYRQNKVEKPFYGVYYGQAALPMEPDTLYTMESDLLKGCQVFNYETNKYTGIYDQTKLEGKDLYEVFLSGPVSLLRIENPNAQTEKELIVFRDSFGSSVVPLLAQGYKTITLVDVRYMSSQMLSRFIDFHGQDVLFLYSTLVLNNSFMLK